MCANPTLELSKQAGRSRAEVCTRKVRAPQSRVLGNSQWGRPQGKCHRNIPPAIAGKGEMVRQELTGSGVIRWPGKPHLEQDYVGRRSVSTLIDCSSESFG
ncbi:MAG: hypothetical protein NVSMB22_09730 [Chloroflexota bacterium]